MYKFGILMATLVFANLHLTESQSLEDILKMGEEQYEEEKNKPVKLPAQNSCYDFIIVGAGPAGCVLANRLSENPNWTVFLIEAGATENVANEVPVLTANLLLTEANWGYKSTPQKRSCRGMRDDICFLPRGKLLGGTSGINFMIYNRGNAADFDRIADAGNYGWSYDEVLPYFKKSEKANLEGLEDSPYHNRSGLLSVEYVKFRTTIADAFLEASVQAGYPLTDYNGESQFGTSYVQTTTENGSRHTAAKAFTLPIIKKRKNLHVLTFATVTKILIDERSLSAYGVNFVRNGSQYTIRAKKEVILSAGAFNSPQLLMLSGVGPRDVLDSVGIKQLVDLPVGKIMYDHMSHLGPIFITNTTGQTLFTDRITPDDIARYEAGDSSTRVSSIGGTEVLTFMKLPCSRYKSQPDIELIFNTVSLASDYGTAIKEGANFKDELYTAAFKPLEGRDHFGILVMPFHPLSTGILYLNSSDPFTPPVIDPKFFSEYEDIEVMLAGIKEAIRIVVESPAMDKINATLYEVNLPGCEDYTFGTDDYWRCSIEVLSYTLHHQIASCKMGTLNDPTAVVSPQLKVHGIRKLRVADTSVVPTPIAGHTNAVSFMIGEKLADMIKEEWRNKRYFKSRV